jgi:hypothetical protein
LLLSSFAVCFCLDSVEPHLICISIPSWLFVIPHAITIRTPPDAAPSNTIEASAEEQQDPGNKGNPNSVANGSRATWNTVHSGFGDEKYGDVKNECDEGDSGTETWYAAAEASHGHLTDVSE